MIPFRAVAGTPCERSMAIGLLMLLLPAPSFAQAHRITLDASVLRGTLGYARAVSGKAQIGIEIGFGFPQFDRTFVPEQQDDGSPDFEEFLHVGLFVRAAPTANLEVDLGVRGSIADLWPCRASDCWPAPFAGAYIQPMAGWRRIKFGPRLTAGWISEMETAGQDGWTTVVGLNPFTARFSVPW